MLPLLIVFLLLQSAPQAPPRDRAAPAEAGAARIAGRILDRDTGRPLAGALVTLHVLNGDAQEAVSGPDGRYRFDELPAGRYAVEAGPVQHRATHLHRFYGAARSIEQAGRRPGFDLARDEHRDDVDVELERAFAITGRVLGVGGEPLANLYVTAAAVSHRGSSGAPTDDRGVFRVFGLAPGAYRVCADPRSMLRSAPVETVGERPVKTCAPAAVSQSEAQIVTLAPRSAPVVEIRLQRRSVYSVSGAVVDASGLAIDRGTVTAAALDGEGRAWNDDVRQGFFSVVGLPPGRYAIRAAVGLPEKPAATLRETDRQQGIATVQVDAEDVSGVTIAMSKAATIRGRILVESEAPAAPNLAAVRILTVVTEPARFERIQQPATVAADRTFTLSDLFGPQLLVINGLPDGWVVRSVVYRGRDILGLPTEFTDPASIDVVVSRHPASLSVRIAADGARAPEDYDVLLLPADPARWDSALGLWRTRPSFKQGQLRFDVPPGDYLILAIEENADALIFDRDDVQRLAKSAQRVTLTANERQTIELRPVSASQVR